MPRVKAENTVAYTLKIPAEIYGVVKIAADKNTRSIAGEMVHRLRASIPPAKTKRSRSMQAAE